MVKHRKKWWKIKTRKKHFRSGRDYQNNDTEDNTEGIMFLDAIVSLLLTPEKKKKGRKVLEYFGWGEGSKIYLG